MQEFISTTQLDKNSKIAASKKATADRRDSMRAVTRVLKIQTNKLSKQDEAHLEGLFIEAKQVHNHLLTLGNLHRESEREQIVANPGHKIQHFDFTHFKGHYIKVRNKRWKNEVRPLRYISAQMKQSIGQKIQSSIF